MSEGSTRRIWAEATVVDTADGFAITLGGRQVKTPAKAALVMPTRAMAEAIAAEWRAQGQKIDPRTMPATRTANSAIDKVQHQHAEVADMLAGYGDADLLCYRADSPAALVARQADQWNPALDWAKTNLGVRLEPRNGLMHEPQEAADLARLKAKVQELTSFQLAAFHDLVCLSGSLILGFAAALDWKETEDIWNLSRLDEIWQEEQWGEDEEAKAALEVKKQAFLHAKRFFDYC